mmetsp:Transcript_40028/g.55628  ORF Transcript_40028/g.55628 Transcript_40028/m.55628 type:complete len:196 (-) Transcript_40028:135-722(-)|eukprot:CAMPEP_0196586680 /NCGR_PEP_ID=MMETSP1081-20130531/55197_1 /TAXON_ID=36882 /ORGANISM="Pyramimonas amylifera, Strain CCMP720" /LENGTH=195 /DNA_ID=CAMNT_0041908643 /DNA_START=168 /DNA_END=755 /DNA_ORIENTATION=-
MLSGAVNSAACALKRSLLPSHFNSYICRQLSSNTASQAIGGSGRAELARKVGGAVLFGATALLTASATDELLLYYLCEKQVMGVVAAHPQMCEVLGTPMTPRNWWNASVKMSSDGLSVQVYLVVDGKVSSSDVYLRAVRLENNTPTLIYNLFGKAQWEILFLDAMLPDKVAGARLPIRVNLMHKNETPEVIPKVI